MRKHCKTERCSKCLRLVFFAMGLLVASFCPPKLLVAVLAVTVIVLGIIGR